MADQTVSEGLVTEIITDETGVFNVWGLDAGTYTLRETTVPAGYNSPGDINLSIIASHEESPLGGSAKLNLTILGSGAMLANRSRNLHDLP